MTLSITHVYNLNVVDNRLRIECELKNGHADLELEATAVAELMTQIVPMLASLQGVSIVHADHHARIEPVSIPGNQGVKISVGPGLAMILALGPLGWQALRGAIPDPQPESGSALSLS